jgi:hypothetical protein
VLYTVARRCRLDFMGERSPIKVNINKTVAANLFVNADVSAITHSRHNMTPSADPYLLLSQFAANYEQ